MQNLTLQNYMKKWDLTHSTFLAQTNTSDIYKVNARSSPQVLKILNKVGQEDEKNGAFALKYFNGHGAVEIEKHDTSALLIEYCDGPLLKSLVTRGENKKATQIIANLLSKIHSKKNQPIPNQLTSLKDRFHSLLNTDSKNNHFKAIHLAHDLLKNPLNSVVLHGDVHHENIIHHKEKGWLIIDPKGLYGENTFDLANSFYNPYNEEESLLNKDRIYEMAQIYSKHFKIDQLRILQYAYCYGHLSAVWSEEDGNKFSNTLKIAKLIEQLIF